MIDSNDAHDPHSAGRARNSRPPSINKTEESGSALWLTDTPQRRRGVKEKTCEMFGCFGRNAYFCNMLWNCYGKLTE